MANRSPLVAGIHASYDPADIGLVYQVPDAGLYSIHYTGVLPGTGWYAIDVNGLYGYEFGIPIGSHRVGLTAPQFWTQFLQWEPDDQLGYSIYLYYIDADRLTLLEY